jgi:hypothetical protein
MLIVLDCTTLKTSHLLLLLFQTRGIQMTNAAVRLREGEKESGAKKER